MGKVQIRRTYPCGYQESIQAEGWGITGNVTEDDRPRPCPNCGGVCRGKNILRD